MTNTRNNSLGLGCMGMSGMYGASREDDGVATIHAAIERGVTFLDTGDFYGSGHNELLIRRAIEGRRDRVELSVKFGALRAPGGGWGGVDNRLQAVKNFITYSLTRLGTDVIDVYRPGRLDPAVPIEDTIGAIAELVKAGYVRRIGLSEVGPDTIRRAHAVHPIADLQIEYSLISRGPEDAIFATLDELGISATLYGVLSRGLLSGSKPTGGGDYRAYLPRFSAEHQAHNAIVVAAFARFARDRGLTPSQLAIAWVRAKRPTDLALIGARTPAQLVEAVGALARELSAAEVAELEAMIAPSAIVGTRYDAAQMARLDSERR